MIHISKSDKYQRLNHEIKWIGGAYYSQTPEPFWDKFDPIHTRKNKNPDDIIIQNAIKTLIKPLSDEKKQKLIKKGKPFDHVIITAPALSGMDNLSKILNKNKSNTIESFYTTQLPESWKNYTDDLNSTDKRLLISTRPMNQQSCGSCYAFACASAINDVFIFGPETQLKFNPNISPMTILSCVAIGDNSQCNGGVPISTLQYISENGVLSSHCINYYETLNLKSYVPKPGSEMNVDEFGNITYVTKTVSEVSTDDLTNLSNVTKY